MGSSRATARWQSSNGLSLVSCSFHTARAFAFALCKSPRRCISTLADAQSQRTLLIQGHSLPLLLPCGLTLLPPAVRLSDLPFQDQFLPADLRDITRALQSCDSTFMKNVNKCYVYYVHDVNTCFYFKHTALNGVTLIEIQGRNCYYASCVITCFQYVGGITPVPYTIPNPYPGGRQRNPPKTRLQHPP